MQQDHNAEARTHLPQLLTANRTLPACTSNTAYRPAHSNMQVLPSCLFSLWATIATAAAGTQQQASSADLSLELVGGHSNCSSRDTGAGGLAPKGAPHTAAAGSAAALGQAQHQGCGLHDGVGTLAAGPHLHERKEKNRLPLSAQINRDAWQYTRLPSPHLGANSRVSWAHWHHQILKKKEILCTKVVIFIGVSVSISCQPS